MTNEEFIFEVRFHRSICESKLRHSRKLISEGRMIKKSIIEEYKNDIVACRLVEGLADELAKSGKLMQFNDHMEKFFAKLPKVDGKGANEFVKQAGIFQKISSKLKTMFSKSSLSDAVAKFYSMYPFYFDIRMAGNRLANVEPDQMAAAITKLPINANSKKYLVGAQESDVVNQVLDIEANDNPGSEFQKYLPTSGQITAGEALKKFFSLGSDIAAAGKTTAQAAASGAKAVVGAAPEVAKGAKDAIVGGIKSLAGGLKGPATGAEGEAGVAAGTPEKPDAGGLSAAAKGAEGEIATAGGTTGSIAAGISDKTSDDDVKAIVSKLVATKGADAIAKLIDAVKEAEKQSEVEADRERLMGGGIDESTSFGRLIEMSIRTR